METNFTPGLNLKELKGRLNKIVKVQNVQEVAVLRLITFVALMVNSVLHLLTFVHK